MIGRVTLLAFEASISQYGRMGMADNKKNRGGADRGLIALGEPYEVAYWSKKFKITPAKLKAAVKKAGHSAKNVEAYIKLQKHKAADRARIAISQPYEVSYWSKKFKVTPAKLKAAVKKAGHSAKNVEAYIKLQKHKAADRARIAMSQPYEVSYWSKKFKVTPARLKAAVAAVGHSSKNVGAYLSKGKAAKKAKKSAKAPRKTAKTPAKKKAA
jgi:hypothetical protein